MVRRVGQNRFHLRDRQPEIGRDVGFIHAGFPILNDVLGGHTGALENRAAKLHSGFHFGEGQSDQSMVRLSGPILARLAVV